MVFESDDESLESTEESELRGDYREGELDSASQTPSPPGPGASTLSEPSIEKSLKRGWEIFKNNIGFLISLQLIWLAFIIGLEVVEYFAFAGAPLFVMTIWLIFYNVANIFITAGIWKIGFKLLDDQAVGYADLFSQGDILLSLVIGYILYFLGIFIGSLLLILPGIYFFLRFFFFDYLIIDNKAGVFESFKKSWRATAGIKTTFFLLLMLVVVAFINLVGLLALGVGLLVTGPVTGLALLEYYRGHKYRTS